jgi:predicted NBD/HSP70 family sugar kinase
VLDKQKLELIHCQRSMETKPQRVDTPIGPNALLKLIREGDGATRADLAKRTGLARSTITQRLEQLHGLGLLKEVGAHQPPGGRPPMKLAFNEDAAVVLAADLGATHSRLALTNLGGRVLAEDRGDIDIAAGPEAVLEWVEGRLLGLLDQAGAERRSVAGIGIGVPGPVEHSTGMPRNPPIMPGWDGFPIPERLSSQFGAPVLVDNDVNIMALGEHWANWRDLDHLLFVKVGTGIGCGIIIDGRVHRGADGAAGDLGHVRIPVDDDHVDVICSCGNINCLEALAGGGAMARKLTEEGTPVRDSRALVELARGGLPAAVQLIRHSGRLIGEVLAAAVNFYNPSVIVIGGDVAGAQEQLLASIREVVYQRSLPLATRHLRVVGSPLDDRAGVVGAAAMVTERVLALDPEFARPK